MPIPSQLPPLRAGVLAAALAALAARAAEFAAPGAAFPTSSVSGTGQVNLEILGCVSKGDTITTCAAITVRPVAGQNADRIGVPSGDAVPPGSDLLLHIVTTGQSGFVLSSFSRTLDGAAPLASSGGNVFDGKFVTGITNFTQSGPGTVSVSLGNPFSSVFFKPNYNGTRGLIGSIIIGVATPVPTPAALGVFGLALAGLLAARGRRA